MNHSEHLALEFAAQTRAMMADPQVLAWDWSMPVLMLSVASLLFLFVLLSAD